MFRHSEKLHSLLSWLQALAGAHCSLPAGAALLALRSQVNTRTHAHTHNPTNF